MGSLFLSAFIRVICGQNSFPLTTLIATDRPRSDSPVVIVEIVAGASRFASVGIAHPTFGVNVKGICANAGS
jgi:hypothetical protein